MGPPSENNSNKKKEVFIIGAGISGLAAARQLLNSTTAKDLDLKVTILEASSDVGGRIKRAEQNFVSGNVVDLGAEYIHCQGHVLWEWIHEFYGKTVDDYRYHSQCGEDGDDDDAEETETESETDKTKIKTKFFEPIFLLSHADGGPDEQKTEQGKYGMYYVDDELMMYNDPRLEVLNEKLEAVFQYEYDPRVSLADALMEQTPPLPDSLRKLVISSYGNTAGCCDISQLSISQLAHFEHYWETNEQEGDFRPPSTIGMYGIVQSCLERLEKYENFELIRNCEVQSIRQGNQGPIIEAANGTSYHADAVIVTVPPPILPEIFKDLPQSKVEALAKIGFERAIKVIIKLRRRLWPSHLQSIISAGEQPIPEIWFRELTDQTDGTTYYLATGFLVSNAADDFVDLIRKGGVWLDDKERQEKAGTILFQQLVTMLQDTLPPDMNVDDPTQLVLDSLMFDWKDDAPFVQGGYMYPRVGITPGHLHALAEPLGNCFFAGEATNTHACCTVQAAIETGQRAASEVESFFVSDV